MRNPSTSIAKGNVENRDSHHGHDVESQIGDLPFTIFPRSQNKTNKRAFGQASRYMNANARKQSQKDTKGAVGMNSEDLPVNGLGCGLKSLITEPVDEDEKIAESTALILMDIANRAGPSVSLEPTADIYLPEFEERNFEELRATDSIESVRAGQPSHDKYCLDPLCEYFTKGFAYKARRDCHPLSHYNCTIICEFCPKTAPRGVSFKSVEALRYHVMFMHFCEEDGSTSACMTCNRSSLDPERFFHHIEGCVLRWMEKRATDAQSITA